MSPLIPGPANISADLFTHLLSVYPVVLKSFYSSKIKDAEKLPSALEDDGWRYELLPAELKTRRAKAGGDSKISIDLGKGELQRLVQWKITHGTYRPFLPALIRKNDPDVVKATTSKAFLAQAAESYKATSEQGLPPKLAEAIKTVSNLQGVGPATAPLICSVFDSENVPFFEDELYEWLFPGGGKLKYNLKEYQGLFYATTKLRSRLNVTAVEVEKVGFVIGHLETLDDDQKKKFEPFMDQQPEAEASKSSISRSPPQSKEEPRYDQSPSVSAKPEKRKASTTASTKRPLPAADDQPESKVETRSKRRRA